ncbi:MAG TPA: peptidoglycan DD-metalloendopeptidase family protein [Candidatus Paceibacterota bacterium]|nr:peptidoglycan DD-metalloendopeptidase family protein [Candidatus Paceibacterota bacterium]
MDFKIKILFLVIFLSFTIIFIAFAFSFSGFNYPFNPYQKKNDEGKLEGTYNWYVSLGLGESWSLANGHLGEDWVLPKGADKEIKNENGEVKSTIPAELGQPVYAIADGVVFKVAPWPECPRDKSHGWGGVVLIKHQILDDVDKTFDLTNTILPDPKDNEEDKKAEEKRVQELEKQGTKVVYSMYGHLKNIQVKEGDTIKKGDKVGEIGEVCYEGSTKKYAPHLHLEIKNQEAIKEDIIIDNIPGVGRGYSYTTAYAPNRYIPSKFIENNKNLVIEEKPITQKPSSIPPTPEGLTSSEENLSFWDKIAFYWNGFVANVKDLFGGTTGEVQVSKPLNESDIQKQTNQEIASPASPPRNDNGETTIQQPTENSSSPSQPSETWDQKLISYKLDEQDKVNGIYKLTLNFQNTGNTTWTKDDVSLNIVGGNNGTAAKFYHPSWITRLRPAKVDTTTQPGNIASFTFLLQFPKEPGAYYPQFRPVRYIKDTNSFSWIGSDKAIFLAEVKESSPNNLTFAGASLYEITKAAAQENNQETTQTQNNSSSPNSSSSNSSSPTSPSSPSSQNSPSPVDTSSSPEENTSPQDDQNTQPSAPPSENESEKEKQEDKQDMKQEENTSLSAPELLSPEDGFKIDNQILKTITFQWKGPSDFVYSIWISNDSNLLEEKSTIIRTGFINDSTDNNIYKYDYSTDSFSRATIYYWQVKGEDENGTTISSKVYSFRVLGWQIETIEENNHNAPFVSLKIDNNGNLAMAYNNDDNEIIYAHLINGTTWKKEKTGINGYGAFLAFDKEGNPAISYYSPHPNAYPSVDLFYAHFNTATNNWEKQNLDWTSSGGQPLLAFDKNNNPFIVYGSNTIFYTYFNGITWKKGSIINGKGSPSLGFDGLGRMCVSYRSLLNPGGSIIIDGLKYACFDGNEWIGTENWVDTVGTAGFCSGCGYYSSLAFDINGEPSISHVASCVGLRYSHFNGKNWDSKTVDKTDSGFNNTYVSLAFNPINNYPSISYLSAPYYYDERGIAIGPGEGDLKYAYFDGLTWQTETVDSEGDVGYFTSLVFDNNGNPAIAYAKLDPISKSYNLKFAIYK